MKIRVYIVDDHPLIIDGFRLNFDDHRRISVVGSQTDPGRALEEINSRRNEIDVVLLDISMPSMSGFEICQRLKASGERPYVVFMTFHVDDVTRMKIDHSSYDGLILKSDRIEDVAEGIKRVYDGPRPALHEAQSTDHRSPTPDLLTQSELVVLYLIAVRGLTSREIAERLSRSEETVYKHRKNIMEKLGIHNVQGLVWYAMSIELHYRPPIDTFSNKRQC